MMKKIVLAKHKNQEIYPVTYSLAIIHKGELLYDFLENIPQPVASDFDIKDLSDVSGLRELWSDKQDTLIAGDGIEFSGLTIKVIGKQDTISDLSLIRSGASLGATSLQPNSLKTINNESLIGSGNIEIQGGASIFGDHLFPHTGTENDVPIRFIGYKGNSEDEGYTGDNWLKIGHDHALLSGKYTLNSGKYSTFNFNAAGFDFKRFDDSNDIKTRFSVKNDISLSARHINFLCLNRGDGSKALTKLAKIIFGDDIESDTTYAHFDNINTFKVETDNGGSFVLNEDGVLTEHTKKVRFKVDSSEFNIKEFATEFKWRSESGQSNTLILNQNGIESDIYSSIKLYFYDHNGTTKGLLRINGNDRVSVFEMEHDGHTNYAVFNNDIHIGSDPNGNVGNKPDCSNDIIKVKSDGKVFVKGIGEFDGTNADTAQTLQDAIGSGGLNEEAAIVIAAALNDLNDRLLAIENSNLNQ